MGSSVPASSQVPEVSEVYDVATLLLKKLQALSPRVFGTLDINLTTQDGRSILSLKAEVGEPKAQHDAARSPATTFHRFKELPAELRAMVWKLALQPPRIFRLGPVSDESQIDFHWRWVPILNPHKPPACAQACREPRAIFTAEAKQLFGSNEGIYRSLWFSPSTDIVYWDLKSIRPYRLEDLNPDFTYIQNLAVDWPGQDELDLEVLLENASSFFHNCKRLIIVMVHKPLPDGDVSFNKVKDDDEMNILFLDDWYQWGELRQEISERFPLSHEQELLSIEGVEVAPVRN
ncbi:hypothetical protein ACHAP5_004791 [Fusarium lateritium]